MAEIRLPIQVNLPDDWIEQIVNRLRNDPEAEWVEIVRCKGCKHNPKESWFGCPMSHLSEEQRPETAWCWKGEKEQE